ncbi:MAG: copper transporter [Microbacterium sp.]|uniref:cytochrome c oxidase assembly protein n=1 Tax=Microbacterium sp. TaxID=51671 RepID=UPI000C636BB8|nr:cytochrome c oxidase assembly protein [Microbacterium sp.]MAY49711.1 copper transporter [Microbacterium sp.]
MSPRVLRAAGPVILVAAALLALVWALAYGGGAAPLILGDAGPVVRWGIPVVKLAVNLAAAGMVGTLVVALYALKAGEREFDVALDAASVSAAVFTVAAGANGFLVFLDSFNAQLSLGPEFGAQLGRFLVETELGRVWLITTVLGAIITVLAFAVRSWTPSFLLALLALAALVPMGTQGHSGEQANHNLAVSSLVLHIIGAAVWLGGLLLMVLIRPIVRGETMRRAMRRYSTLALVSFIVVAISGTVRAAIGIGDLGGLLTPYGVIVLVKVVALVAIGLLGAIYRNRLIDRMTDATRGVFWMLIALELAFMGIASGAASALARPAPPTDSGIPEDVSPAFYLTGDELPAELLPSRWLTVWDIDVLWAFAAGFGLFFYLAGVWRLHRRGDAWPIYRTVMWVSGLLLLVWVTCGAPNAYQDYLFSVHMLGHMLLSMGIPVLLVAGAPVTLAARAIRKRDDGTRGGREWVLWIVHSPYMRVLTNPFVAAGLFVVSLWLFYYTDLFRWALYDHIGHVWMVAHFLLTGYLFALTLIGVDPVAYRLPYAGRLLLLVGVMAMHAFFGVAMMMQTGLMASEWYGAMGRTWGLPPLDDQYLGGGIAWSVGEIPTLTVAITLAIQWSRSDERMQRRRDRAADRSGDAELEEYNARLAKLAERDKRAEEALRR